MPITVLKKDDGFWLRFVTVSKGMEALVNITAKVECSGDIVKDAVRIACEECAADTKVEKITPTNSAMDAISRSILDDALFVIDYLGDILNGLDMVLPEDESKCNERIERVRSYAKLHQ